MIDQLKIDAERFSGFLTTHYPPSREWEDPVGYCAWYISHGYAAVVVDDNEIVAMGAARPVDRPGFGVLPFYANENGSCLHVDLLINVAEDERPILALWNLIRLRFGPRKTVTMFRHDSETALKIYDFAKFSRSVTRIKKTKTRRKENQHREFTKSTVSP